MPIRRAIAARRTGYRTVACRGLARVAKAGVASSARVLVFEDESGCYLLPGLVRTLRSRGADASHPRGTGLRDQPVDHRRDDPQGQKLLFLRATGFAEPNYT